MPELALGESPVGARGLCWPPQPWVGTEMGTPEPGLGKGVDCGAPVCQSPCTQGLPAPRVSLPAVLTQAVHACGSAADLPQPVPFFHTQAG